MLYRIQLVVIMRLTACCELKSETGTGSSVHPISVHFFENKVACDKVDSTLNLCQLTCHPLLHSPDNRAKDKDAPVLSDTAVQYIPKTLGNMRLICVLT